MELKQIIDAIRKDRIRITEHADEEAQNDSLCFDEIYYSTIRGEIIEDYPHDRPYPSCLINGNNAKGDPIHSV